MFNNSKIAKSIQLALAFGAASAGFVAPASAQEDDSAEAVEKISVTGSRIRKVDFTTNAPVATIGQEQFQLTATVNTESLLNTLPQVVPGLDRTSNNPGNGTATVDLRGLGSFRTLVLVNGTRATPTSSNGVVDINTIPTTLIKDVEVLTGGASAVYGSDAVAGVVNFILKDDFEGIQINGGYESSEEGDATFYTTDLTIGANTADGKGNVVFNFAYTDRDEVFQADRDFSFFALTDGSDSLINGGSTGIPQTSIFNGGFSDFSPLTAGILFNQDGSIRPFVDNDTQTDNYNYAPENYLQLPQTRHQISALGHYEISDNAKIYGRALFTDSEVPSQLAPAPAFLTSTFTLDGNPFITPEAQAVLSDAIGDGVDTDGDGIADTATALLRRRLEEVGPRRSEDGFSSYQFQVGVDGSFGDSNWTYNAYYQTGQTENTAVQLGNVNGDRFQQALLLATDENGQVILDENGNPSCSDPGSNGGTVGCAPLNLFGEGNISEDAAAFLRTAVVSTQIFEQDVAEASVAGDTEGWLELPGGPIGIAFGVQHIENRYEFLPSQDLDAGTIIGFNGSPASAGSYKVDEYYVEAYLPILEGVPFADLLDLELAYRTSDYSTVGTTEAYKVAGSWAPVEELRFRAGFNRAVRAPNIAELFSPQGEGFPGATDPCSAAGATSTSEAVRALCIATGVPADVVFSPAIDAPSSQVRTLTGGNPDLEEESADTLTVGVVYTPLDNLSISLDYFDIEIEDAITGFGGGTQNILTTCYDANDPTGGLGSPFCNSVSRRADGTIDFVLGGLQNVAVQTLTGFDLIASYSFDLLGGSFAIDYLGTYTDENDFLPFEGGDLIECAGRFGNICGEPIQEYKHRTTFKWSGDALTAQILWRYIGSVEDDDPTQDFIVEEIGSVSYFDASASYVINDNYRVTVGIDNLLDKEPPLIGTNQEQANTYPATYDVFGRTYYVNFTATF